MRLFQNSGLMPAYVPRLRFLTKGKETFFDQLEAFLADRFGATHFLKPVLDRSHEAFFTNGDDDILQRAWARENGLAPNLPLDQILLTQIEQHRTEVFYCNDPVRYGSAFLKRLPGTVKHRLAWRAAPSGKADFSGYDLILNNFPSILETYRREGMRAAWFSPAHDPVMDNYNKTQNRPVDIAFIGTYSRHHQRRAALIETIASLANRYRVTLHLDDSSRFLRLTESPLGLVGPLRKHRRPASVRAVSQGSVFGLDLYRALGSARIVVNGAIDMAGDDRGNMRCWEAMGSGALLLTDKGNYPPGMVDGETMVVYNNIEDAVSKIHALLKTPAEIERIAQQGNAMIKDLYSKNAQFSAFNDILNG